MAKEVVVKISADGKSVEAEGFGFKGKGCEQVINSLVDSLGAKAKTRKKPEYNLNSGQTVKA